MLKRTKTPRISRAGLNNISRRGDKEEKFVGINGNLVIVNRAWAKKVYDSLSTQARTLVDETVNHIFWLKKPERWNKKLDPSKPSDKPYVKHWLEIRDELMGNTGQKYWRTKVSEYKKLRKDVHNELRKAPVKAEFGRSAQVSQVRIMGKSDPGDIKQAIQEGMNTHGVDKVKFALNICNNLSTDHIKSLSKTSDGLEAVLLLQGALFTKTNKKVLQEIERIASTFSTDSFPGPTLSKLKLSQGILSEGMNGKQFYNFVRNRFLFPGADKSVTALELAKRLLKKHIMVAKQTPEGLQALTEIRKQLTIGSYDEEKQKEAELQLKRMGEILCPGSTGEYKKSAYGIIERYGYGKKLRVFVENEISIGKDKAAIRIIEGFSDKDLIKVAHNAEGRKSLLSAYKILIESNEKNTPEQSVRILDALQAISNLDTTERRIAKQNIPIFPVRHTFFYNAPPFATITKNGQIQVKLSNRVRTYEKFKAETKSIPTAVFLQGKNFKAEEIVGFKLYDEGGVVIYRPAAYLLAVNKQSVDYAIKKAGDMAMLAPGSMGSTFAARGSARLVEKALDMSARVIIASNLFVIRQNRGWLIKNYGDDGRAFAEVMDRAERYAQIYGQGKMIVSPILGKLHQAWKRIQDSNRSFNKSDQIRYRKVNEATQKFMEVTDDALGRVRRPKSEGIENQASLKQLDSTNKTTSRALIEAEQRFKKLEQVVTDRQNQDMLEAGIAFRIDKDNIIIHSIDEDGLVLHIENKSGLVLPRFNAEKEFTRMVRTYPEREWELIKDTKGKNFYLVHGVGAWDRGQVCQRTIKSEFIDKGIKTRSIQHYHPRKGQIDYITIFPSKDDWIVYYDQKIHPETTTFSKIKYLDYTSGKLNTTYFTKIPTHYADISPAKRKVLEKWFGHPPDSDAPYLLRYKDPMHGEWVSKQFKDLNVFQGYIKKQNFRWVEKHTKLTSISKEKTSQKELSVKKAPLTDNVSESLKRVAEREKHRLQNQEIIKEQREKRLKDSL